MIEAAASIARETPAMDAPIHPDRVSAVMIVPAMPTPMRIAKKDGRSGKSRMEAAMAPVHAPVRGRGRATKSMSAVSAR